MPLPNDLVDSRKGSTQRHVLKILGRTLGTYQDFDLEGPWLIFTNVTLLPITGKAGARLSVVDVGCNIRIDYTEGKLEVLLQQGYKRNTLVQLDIIEALRDIPPDPI